MSRRVSVNAYGRTMHGFTWSHWFVSDTAATQAPGLPPSATVYSRARWAEPKFDDAVTDALGICPFCIPRGA